MAEGKTLVPTAPCSLCDEGDAVKFCIDCGQDLCSRCAKAHGKIQATTHHKLIAIGNNCASSAIPKTKQAYCTEHNTKPLSVICEECLCALCDTCADTAHKNHKLLRTNLNATVLQQISIQKMPEFMEILHKLQKEKDGSPVKLQLYKMARDMVKSWRDRLRNIVDQDSQRLLTEIETEIKKQEHLLADINSNLQDSVKTTDNHMAVLGNARKVDDPATLLSNIHEGDRIISKATSLLTAIESTRETYTIDDLLPFRNEVNNTEKSLRNVFTMTPLKSRTVAYNRSTKLGKSLSVKSRNYKTMVKKYNYKIGDLKMIEFGISESSKRDSNTVVIYHEYCTDIHVIDIDSGQHKEFTSAKKIKSMATLSTDRHVIVEVRTYDVFLLDGNFNIVSEFDRSDKYIPSEVYPVTSNTFILSEYRTFSNKTQLSEVSVSPTNIFSTKILCEVDFKDDTDSGLLALHKDQKHITMQSSSTVLQTVDLTTGKYTTLDLTSQIGVWFIYSICMDEADQILVGGSNGRLYLANPVANECELPNMEGLGIASGISIRGDKVVTVIGEYINVYQ